jgi:hypothetical protein
MSLPRNSSRWTHRHMVISRTINIEGLARGGDLRGALVGADVLRVCRCLPTSR